MAETDRERWNARYLSGAGAQAPSAFLCSLDGVLPRSGRALDVAGGVGQESLWLARRGLFVTLVDVADAALARAQASAREAGLALGVERRDVEREPLPPGPFEVVLCLNYLWRPLFAAWAQVLAPGGWLVFAQPTRTNLTRHAHPSARFLLEDGELPGLLHGLVPSVYTEAWTEEGRYEARLVARRVG